MAKRLTDTLKWKNLWFSDMPSKYKLFWLYINDDCDHAGIWIPNFKVAKVMVGEDIEPTEAKRYFAKKITILEDEKWHINDFIKEQYNATITGLNPKNKVHLSVLKLLNNYLNFKPLVSPLLRAKEKAKEKDINMDMDMKKEEDMDTERGGTGEISKMTCLPEWNQEDGWEHWTAGYVLSNKLNEIWMTESILMKYPEIPQEELLLSLIQFSLTCEGNQETFNIDDNLNALRARFKKWMNSWRVNRTKFNKSNKTTNGHNPINQARQISDAITASGV